MAKTCHPLYADLIFFIHSPVEGHRALLWAGHYRQRCNEHGGYISLQCSDFLSFGRTPRSEIARSHGNFIVIFFKELPLCFPEASCIPTNGAFPFSISAAALVVYWFTDDGHSDRCEVTPHCDSDLHFPDDE